MPKNKLSPIDEKLIITKIQNENEWWASKKIDEYYAQMQKRLYFDLFYPLVLERDVRRAIVLMGPRRVGKTVMMFHTIGELLNTGIQPTQIFFFSIDSPLYLHKSLEELLLLGMKASGKNSIQDCFIFFDEIQYLKNWEQHLKSLVDSYPHTKFIASGSAAAALKLKSQESGAGRFTDFMLPPLTFQEYIHLKDLKHLISKETITWQNKPTIIYKSPFIQELNEHFIDYVNFGGYPEVIFSETIQKNPQRYLKSDIVDKVLLRDLPSLYGIEDVQELNNFFTYLAYYSGNELSLETLSQSTRIDKNLLKKYLEYLQSAFLIKVIHRIDDTAKRFQRANFYKIFLTNPSLRSALFTKLSPTDKMFGNMVETAIYAQWLHRDWFVPYYARWSAGQFQGEVDMVRLHEATFKPEWALEIKWSNRYYEKPQELKSLLQFCKKNNLSAGLVTTIDQEGIRHYDTVELHFIPASVYAYTIGANTLSIKKHKEL